MHLSVSNTSSKFQCFSCFILAKKKCKYFKKKFSLIVPPGVIVEQVCISYEILIVSTEKYIRSSITLLLIALQNLSEIGLIVLEL